MHNNKYENDAYEEGKIVGSDEGKDETVDCDKCCQNPCDWTMYGPCLMEQIKFHK